MFDSKEINNASSEALEGEVFQSKVDRLLNIKRRMFEVKKLQVALGEELDASMVKIDKEVKLLREVI